MNFGKSEGFFKHSAERKSRSFHWEVCEVMRYAEDTGFCITIPGEIPLGDVVSPNG